MVGKTEEMKRAVCGFLFSFDEQHIVLIHKKRPDWQAGKLNGVGGKVEEGEFAIDAMRREFEEETGVRIENWDPFLVLDDQAHSFEVTYYRAAYKDLSECKTTTDEEIEVVQVGAIFTLPVIHNLTWIIPMALDPNVTSGKATWRKNGYRAAHG